MIDFNKSLVAALSETGLEVHYELFVNASTTTPCITYLEANNADDQVGDTLQYSRLAYNIKVWGKRVADLQMYARSIDIVMKELGFRRISMNELSHGDMIQKTMRYEAIAYEVK